VPLRRHFKKWGERYLDVDPQARARSPEAAKVPSGPFQDIYDAGPESLPMIQALCASPS
jgi:hypothetical protein